MNRKYFIKNVLFGIGAFMLPTSPLFAVKQQIDFDFEQVTVYPTYISGFVKVAKEMLIDLPDMQSFIQHELEFNK